MIWIIIGLMDLYLDDNSILCVGGRVRNFCIEVIQKYLIFIFGNYYIIKFFIVIIMNSFIIKGVILQLELFDRLVIG